MVIGVSDMLYEAWRSSRDEKHKERLEELMTYILIGFGAGLRGEEVPLTSLTGIIHFWEEIQQSKNPYLLVTLYGRFKGEAGFSWHCLPILDRTRSGIPHRLWIGRLMRQRVTSQGRLTWWLFHQSKGRKTTIADYDANFLYYIGLLHERCPKLFSVGTLLGLFPLRRSMRRGDIVPTMERVSEVIINLMNQWRKKDGAKGAEPGISMHQTYTQMRNMVQKMRP